MSVIRGAASTAALVGEDGVFSSISPAVSSSWARLLMILGFEPRLKRVTEKSVDKEVLNSVNVRRAMMKPTPKATTMPKF